MPVYLLRLDEVGHVAIVVDAARVEARASPLRAEAGDEAGLALVLRCIDGADLHPTTHHLQQPVSSGDVEALQMQV